MNRYRTLITQFYPQLHEAELSQWLITTFFYSFQIASHSKSSTKRRFWNRSFHILSCEDKMGSSGIKPNPILMGVMAHHNNTNHRNENSNRLDRKHRNARITFADECSSWRRCSWQNFLVFIIIVLLNLATTIECLQPRQEGTWAPIKFYLITTFAYFFIKYLIKTMRFKLFFAQIFPILTMSFALWYFLRCINIFKWD